MLQLERKCILVIEVAEDIREIIRRSLENIANWRVLSANSISEGLALIKIQRQQPDVILLEANLINSCDRRIWRELQIITSTRSIPIIFMAARVRAVDRLQFKQLGAVEAISKPFKPQDLVETIAQLF